MLRSKSLDAVALLHCCFLVSRQLCLCHWCTEQRGISCIMFAAPMFAYAGYLWSLEQPSHIKGIIAGTWYSADGEAMIKFNSKGVCFEMARNTLWG